MAPALGEASPYHVIIRLLVIGEGDLLQIGEGFQLGDAEGLVVLGEPHDIEFPS